MPAQPATPALTADAAPLLQHNSLLLDQLLALVAAHERPGGPDFSVTVGPHLRHIIEHHEALLMPTRHGVADYDSRARDREVERRPALARQRLLALQHSLRAHAGVALQAAVEVRGLGGLAGEFSFAVASTFGRELAFVASHAVHHCALLRAHCQQHGIAVDAAFGVASATAAHARAAAMPATPLAGPVNHPVHQESPCLAFSA
jgi:hypothetical protein